HWRYRPVGRGGPWAGGGGARRFAGTGGRGGGRGRGGGCGRKSRGGCLRGCFGFRGGGPLPGRPSACPPRPRAPGFASPRGLVLSQGRSVSDFGPQGEAFRVLGAGEVASVPGPVFFMLVVAIVGATLMAGTPWGYRLYAIGGHEEAARLAGIPVAWTKFGAYV